MQNAYRERFSADGANIAELHGFAGFKDHVAGAMTVQMVFSFFREKLHGPVEHAVGIGGGCFPARGTAQSLEQTVVTGLTAEQIGFATEILARVGVGVGDKGVAVECAPQAVHVRVGGKAGFQRENMG